MENINFEIFKYAPFKSFVHPTFWYKLAEIKIDVDRLSNVPKRIYGFYTNYKAQDNILEVDYSAFNNLPQPPQHNFSAFGTLYIKNELEEFMKCNKIEALAAEGEKIQNDIDSGAAIKDPRLLSRFMILSHLNLKAHKYHFWFAFPVPLEPNAEIERSSAPKKILQDEILAKNLQIIYTSLTDEIHKSFFILMREGDNFKHYKIEDLISIKAEENFINYNSENVYFCFSDPSEFEQPSWLLRLFIYFLFVKCPNLHGKIGQFIGVRMKVLNNCDDSLTWKLRIPEKKSEKSTANNPNWIGWEENKNAKFNYQVADMAATMNPHILAENSINLNLKLMKWRLLPELDLDVIANTKCLLLGAGTLGCAVARNLLGWGFKTITFVDSGKVGYSNPVRQCLYTHKDAETHNSLKAETAAKRLKEINPNVITNGVVLQIPMPGHTVGGSLRDDATKAITTLEDLIKTHDAIFLLTDSRESRWLPTLLGTFHKKIVISTALGFDSYLIIRHGSDRDDSQQQRIQDIEDLKCIAGSELGCYFCNDVTAPGNSQIGRTLDQQCTVTRPGVSNIAASYAVELLVALLQQEEKDRAPAYFYTTPTCTQEIPEGLLGIIPHSIRGSLTTYSNIHPATTKFPHCIACSQKVLREFEKRRYDMLFDVFETNKYLEDLTGITALKLSEKQINDIEDFDSWSD